MKKLIEIQVKPMSLNNAYRGRRYATKDLEAYKLAVYRSLMPHIGTIGWYDKYVEIHYTFFIKDLFRVDVDNLVKPLQDCLVKQQMIPDDRYVMKIICEKRKVQTQREERTLVEIKSYNQ